MATTIDLAGRCAFVTGAASGIGQACAERLHAAGARVIVADKNAAAGERVAASLDGLFFPLDVADESSVVAAARFAQERCGGADILVNAAGVLQRTLPPSQLSMREWDIVTQVDQRGVYLCCAKFGDAMAQRRRGAIVNIASVAGMSSGPLHGYGPAKAAVISLTTCLAAEWGRSGVRVNCVSPGFTDTPALRKGVSKGVLDDTLMRDHSALGRLIRSDEIANAVLFLASDLASAVTGINVPVDAGFLVAGPWVAFGGLRAE